jgi:hypothetical protein
MCPNVALPRVEHVDFVSGFASANSPVPAILFSLPKSTALTSGNFVSISLSWDYRLGGAINAFRMGLAASKSEALLPAAKCSLEPV